MSMQRNLLPNQNTWWIDILMLLILLGGLFFILLGVRPLFVPDEGRYAEIGREMVNSGNYITPYLNHIKYFEKPILFYWLESAAIKIVGANLWSLRSINALFALFGCLFTYITARQLYNRTTGLFAAFILSTSMLYFVMAHMISLDLPVTVFIAASLYAFLLGLKHSPGWKRRIYFWGAAIASALAVLTKGLIGLVFPGMIIVVWVAILSDWRSLKPLYLPSCLLIFLIITAPWHILVAQHNPEFFYFYFIKQHFLRYATKEVGHYQPSWFFIPYLILGFFPWIVFLPQAIAKHIPLSWKQRQQNKIEIFFLLWIFLIFIFFSYSKSKLIPYILPIFPPLAILTAHYLQQVIAQHQYRGLKIGYIVLLVFAAIIAYVFYSLPQLMIVANSLKAQHYLGIAAAILLFGNLIACLSVFRHFSYSILITFFSSWFFLLVTLAAVPYIETRTISPLAMQLKTILKPDDDVISYNQYYQDLPFYLERRISILNWRNELSYGMQYQPTQDWMINDNQFWQRWHSEKRIFVIMDLEVFQQFQHLLPKESIFLIGNTKRNILISNKQ